VTDEFKAKMRRRLDDACADDSEGAFTCATEELEALCADVLEAEMVRTNRILRRERKNRRRRRGPKIDSHYWPCWSWPRLWAPFSLPESVKVTVKISGTFLAGDGDDDGGKESGFGGRKKRVVLVSFNVSGKKKMKSKGFKVKQ